MDCRDEVAVTDLPDAIAFLSSAIGFIFIVAFFAWIVGKVTVFGLG
jgi:hypothetical protein